MGQMNDKDEMMHEMYQAPDYLNFNQFLWSKGIAKEYAEKLNRRYSVIVRAGTCGIQRYGAALWPGDEPSTIEEMRSSTNAAQTLTLSGLDFVSSDAGGFVVSDQSDQIYSMWYANVSATRYNLKPHKYLSFGNQKQTSSPAVYGNLQDNLANTIERYALSPYYYSSAMDISTFGEKQGDPFTTTLFFKYQYLNDFTLLQEALFGNKNSTAQMVGPNLLYLLLTSYTDTQKSVYLPKDTIWFDYRQNIWVSGAQNYTTPIQ